MRAEKAMEYKNSGYNCTQAVLKAYEDILPIEYDKLNMLASGFAIGMGSFESTCGALIGSVMAVGMLNNTSKRTPTIASTMLSDFKELSGATICKELKGIETGKVLCKCTDCVKNACIILENKLKELGVDINA